jgi:hypothetical protein
LDDADARRWCKVPLNLTSTFNKKCIWTDGNNIYYSDLLEHHIFDMNNKRWIAIDWSCPCAVNIVPGSVWNKEDGTYYSKGATYKFNSTTKEWEKFKFKGYTSLDTSKLWSDGKYIYHDRNAMLLPKTAKLYSKFNDTWNEICDIDVEDYT